MSARSLTKGANLPIGPTTVRAELRWTAGPGVPAVEVSALLLAAADRVRGEADEVCYDRPRHPSGAVHHRGRTGPGGERIELELPSVEPEVQRIMITACTRGGAFGRVPGLTLLLTDTATGAGIARFEMTADRETALVAGEFYRRGGGWKFRAVAQGYTEGPAGLAAAYGTTVRAAPLPVPPPAPTPTLVLTRPQAPPPPVRAPRTLPGEERLPVDLRKRLNLRKEQVAVSLRKHGAQDLTARVLLVLDASGSMTRLYARGVVGEVVERMAAVAAQLDDDGTMQAWTFATAPARLPDLTIGELPQWIGLHVRVGEMSLFRRRRLPLPDGRVDMKAVGIQNEEQKVIAEVRAHVRRHPLPVPTLVLFFSDGGVYRNEAIERELRAAVEEPVFWQFVGLGRGDYGVLEHFDRLPGRRVDNVGFFAVDDIATLPDAELYDRLLSEFPRWITAARRAGILR